MKKILLMMILCLMMSASVSAYTLTRVSDLSVYDFYNKYNDIATNVEKNYLTMKFYPSHDEKSSDNEYNVYVTRHYNGDNSVNSVIALFANKQGHVSKIVQVFDFNNTLERQVSTGITYNLLYTLGLTKDEVNNVSEVMYQNPDNNDFLFKCRSINRSVAISKERDGKYMIVTILGIIE